MRECCKGGNNSCFLDTLFLTAQNSRGTDWRLFIKNGSNTAAGASVTSHKNNPGLLDRLFKIVIINVRLYPEWCKPTFCMVVIRVRESILP